MKILVIGGSGFIGPFVVQQLVAKGHQVTVFYRGNSKPQFPDGVRQIFGDRNQLQGHRADFEREGYDAVIDVILSSERQASALIQTFRGMTRRIVALSSQDVYRAYGVLLGIDDGPEEELPLTETSELRSYPPYPPGHAKHMQSIFSWLDDDYDKVRVERALNASSDPPVTVLRLPMVYGPGDPLHRFHGTLKRIDDGRTAILLDASVGNTHSPRGYVEDVAHAVVLATLSPRAPGRTYNVVQRDTFTEREWTQKIADAVGWKGSIHVLPSDKIPPNLRMPVDSRQDWIVSSARIRRELGYKEIFLPNEGLRRTIEWERANPPEQAPLAQFDYAAEDRALNDLKGKAES
jgi:nucleoside-diphosphate-sugar epimerase